MPSMRSRYAPGGYIPPRHRSDVEPLAFVDEPVDVDPLPGALGDWRDDLAYAFVVFCALFGLAMLGMALLVAGMV